MLSPEFIEGSKHERRRQAPFDKLRVNGDSLTEQHWVSADETENVSADGRASFFHGHVCAHG